MSSTVDRPATSSAGENLATALNEGVQSAVSALPPSLLAEPSYPARITFQGSEHANRFWAFPVIGFAVKALILIPHLLLLGLLGMAVALLQIGLWIPVLLTGAYPTWAHSLVSGTLRWQVRLEAFLFGLTDRYPPFTLAEESDQYPVQVTFEPQATYNAAWAVPILGLFVKLVLLIPHFLILSVFRTIAGVLLLVLWIPVLFTGSYPEWGYQLIGGFLRWSTRVAAYLLGLTDRYPPFRLG